MMTTAAPELVFATASEGPSLFAAALRMGLAVALVCAAAWAWFYWQRRVKGPTRHLEVIDRAILARGASVTLLRVDERRLLVGVSPDGVRLLRDMDAEDRFGALLEDASGSGEVLP